MKTIAQPARVCAKGITLLELTVVILVLLMLVGVLFVGARAWKRGTDRATCILNLQNVQKAVRSYCNMNNHMPGDTVDGLRDKVIGVDSYVKEPVCPSASSGNGYDDLGDQVPDVGALYMECQLMISASHTPPATDNW